MNAEQDRNHAEAGTEPRPETVHAARRRFTRAGLSASVVMGSLVSKPVLGAAPYRCTVSGQVSGNMSPRPGDNDPCASGNSLAFWKDALTWPAPSFLKGTLPNGQCNWPSGQSLQRGTNFNGFSAGSVKLVKSFFNKPENGSCSVQFDTSGTLTNKATMYQVLSSTSTDAAFELGRATVVSLLNSVQFAPNYAVTTSTVIAMYNATVNGIGKYQVNSTVQWDRGQVTSYLQSLYPGPSA
jgi:hypothetical protein